MNRRIVATGVAGALVLGSVGGIAATTLFGDAAPSASTAGATDQIDTPESWRVEARAAYDAIAPLTEQAGEAVQAGDDEAYAAANDRIARELDGMPVHPNGEVNALYAAVAQQHRSIASNADIDGEATLAAQDRIIALLERVHEIVPSF